MRTITIPNTTRDKLRVMTELAEAYGGTPYFRSLAAAFTRANGYDLDGLAEQLADAVRSIRYLQEAGEQIQTPLQTLRVGYGDCDDLCVLYAALATAIGVPWRYAYSDTHIWVEAGPSWAAFELTR